MCKQNVQFTAGRNLVVLLASDGVSVLILSAFPYRVWSCLVSSKTRKGDLGAAILQIWLLRMPILTWLLLAAHRRRLADVRFRDTSVKADEKRRAKGTHKHALNVFGPGADSVAHPHATPKADLGAAILQIWLLRMPILTWLLLAAHRRRLADVRFRDTSVKADEKRRAKGTHKHDHY